MILKISKYKLLAACSMCAFVFSGCELSSNKLGDSYDFGENDPNKVLVMGDSISAGGYSGGSSWPSRFAGIVGKNVVNESVPGTESADGLSRIDSLLASVKPGFVIIWYGSNDAIRGVDASATAAALKAMVRKAVDNRTIPVVAYVTPMAEGRSIYNGNVESINSYMNKIDALKVNTYNAIIDDPTLYLEDGIHLNDLGESVMALEFADVFL